MFLCLASFTSWVALHVSNQTELKDERKRLENAGMIIANTLSTICISFCSFSFFSHDAPPASSRRRFRWVSFGVWSVSVVFAGYLPLPSSSHSNAFLTYLVLLTPSITTRLKATASSTSSHTTLVLPFFLFARRGNFEF